MMIMIMILVIMMILIISEGHSPRASKCYMRNLLGWLGTRLAQTTLTYLNVA